MRHPAHHPYLHWILLERHPEIDPWFGVWVERLVLYYCAAPGQWHGGRERFTSRPGTIYGGPVRDFLQRPWDWSAPTFAEVTRYVHSVGRSPW